MNRGSDIQLLQSKETRKLIAHSCKNTLCNCNTASVCVCVPRLPTYPTKRSRQSGCWSCTCRTNNLWILQSKWDQYKLIAHNCSSAIEPTDKQIDPVRPRRKTSRSDGRGWLPSWRARPSPGWHHPWAPSPSAQPQRRREKMSGTHRVDPATEKRTERKKERKKEKSLVLCLKNH